MIKHISVVIALAALIGLTTGKVCLAQETEKKLTVTSERQSIDYAHNVLVYEKNVKANWANYTVKAEKIEVYLTSEQTLDKIIATGGVTVTQNKQMQASCQKLTYLAQKEILTLEKSVQYQDDVGNSIEAEKITVWLQEEKLQAEGSPVKATFMVKEEETRAPGGESK